MSNLIINGGDKLYGTIQNQISKNATLPILASTILLNNETKLIKIPHILDVENMLKILTNYSAVVSMVGDGVVIDTRNCEYAEIGRRLNGTMRSSLFLIGPCLSRFGQTTITMPGGCKIGARPIDVHLDSFKKMGVKVSKLGDKLYFNASHAHSAKIKLKIASVGATENIIMFASKLKGKTTIINPAREPEIVDLCNFLNSAGAKIIGAGTSRITICGVKSFKNTEYMPMFDRIVAGTVAIATAINGGDVTIVGDNRDELKSLIGILRKIGCNIVFSNDSMRIIRDKPLLPIGNISTGFYPDFPTDLQSMMLVLMCYCPGESRLTENVFENRLGMVKPLSKMGANICLLNSKTVKAVGVNTLKPVSAVARDLRGGAGLVLAGLSARGVSRIKNVKLIDRGYESIEKIFSSLGAKIDRI